MIVLRVRELPSGQVTRMPFRVVAADLDAAMRCAEVHLCKAYGLEIIS